MKIEQRISRIEDRLAVEKQQFEAPIIVLSRGPEISEPVEEWLTYKQRPTAKPGCLPPPFIADPRLEHEARLRTKLDEIERSERKP